MNFHFFHIQFFSGKIKTINYLSLSETLLFLTFGLNCFPKPRINCIPRYSRPGILSNKVVYITPAGCSTNGEIIWIGLQDVAGLKGGCQLWYVLLYDPCIYFCILLCIKFISGGCLSQGWCLSAYYLTWSNTRCQSSSDLQFHVMAHVLHHF